ncbi:hypothetical protein EJB05_11954, partial [Eragrostis curvula]
MATQARSVRSHLESPASPRQLPALTDDVLEEILIRITCPAALTRASAACVAFRRLITDRTFLRRYRSRHPPLLLGFLNIDVRKGFHPVAAPHPNAAAARALGNIFFNFLPPPSLENWYISDVRDIRVLFRFIEHFDGTAVMTGLVNKLLKVDIERMEFSTVDLPPGHENLAVVVVDAGKGTLGMFSYDRCNGKFLNCYNRMQNEDQRANEWQMKKVIPLPVDDNFGAKFWIYGAPQGYVFIQGDSEGQDSKHTTIYSLEIKTLKIELVTQMSYHFEGHPYFGFLPSISPRRI